MVLVERGVWQMAILKSQMLGGLDDILDIYRVVDNAESFAGASVASPNFSGRLLRGDS